MKKYIINFDYLIPSGNIKIQKENRPIMLLMDGFVFRKILIGYFLLPPLSLVIYLITEILRLMV